MKTPILPHWRWRRTPATTSPSVQSVTDLNLAAGDELTFSLVTSTGGTYSGPFKITKTGPGTATIATNGGPLDADTLALHGLFVK